MSLLERVGLTRPAATGRVGRADSDSRALDPWWLHLLPGVRVAVGTWLVLVLPALLVWVVAPLTTVPWGQAVAVASAGWFLAHGIPVAVGGVSVSLAPLGLLLLVLAVTTRSLRRLLDSTEAAAPGTTWERLLVARILPGYAGGYGLAAIAFWLLTLAGPVRPHPLLLLGVLWVPLVAAAICLVRRHLRGETTPLIGGLLDRLPRWATRAVGPGLQGALALVTLGAVLVVAAMVARLGEVTGLHSALAPGFVGGVALVVGQLLLAPNLALWGLAWLAGPGFSIASGSSITLAAAHPGLMPMLPVLGALPSGGSFPGWFVMALALPVLVGVAISWRATRDLARLSSWRTKLLTSATAAALATVVVTVLTALGSGSVGIDRLRSVGPSPLLLGVAVLGELLLGVLLHIGVDRLRQHRR